ncbi:DUF2913 family protein [Salmonella enterica]|nr:DUF2913 family protein [Salmonella enterica]EBE6145524.1 DUF2913 family protein [Salmonella enterica]EEG7113559.1 DUF2913 family protein [Salmonella enterica]EIK7651432.1 DUF2913 family protein [Salmonella enterica]EJZ7016009.1 DUF2913 family protein [Salmonella enterica]
MLFVVLSALIYTGRRALTALYQPNPAPELTHMCWCLMVAVNMARHAGQIPSPLQEHLFIMQWLANAQKRHLFPKTVAKDISIFIAYGKQFGFGAKLYDKVESIYRSGLREPGDESALFRFNHLIETLKKRGWFDHLMSSQEWENYQKLSETANAVYTSKDLLNDSFDDKGALVRPLPLRFIGDTSGILHLFDECRFVVRQLPEASGFSVMEILPQ